MRTKIKRVLSVLLVLLTFVSIIPITSAVTVSSASLTTMTFYVNAKNKNTTKISYSCTRGKFATNTGGIGNKYGYFEVQIWGRNSTSQSWTYLSKTNLKNASSSTLSMKGYTQYKVRVYAWNTATIGSYIGGIYNSVNASWITWLSGGAPTCTFKAKSNVSHLAR